MRDLFFKRKKKRRKKTNAPLNLVLAEVAQVHREAGRRHRIVGQLANSNLCVSSSKHLVRTVSGDAPNVSQEGAGGGHTNTHMHCR